MLVVDTSAIIAALAASPPDSALLERLADDGDLHAPHLVDVELLHVLRGLIHRGGLSPDRAADALTDFADLTLVRYSHEPLRHGMWQLRDDLTAYDAAFTALAEVLGAPLLACDARLARAPHRATVELFGA